jgi:phosphotransferase system HPr-like phosphotransfer protein
LSEVGAFSVTLEPHVVDGNGLHARAASVLAIDDL